MLAFYLQQGIIQQSFMQRTTFKITPCLAHSPMNFPAPLSINLTGMVYCLDLIASSWSVAMSYSRVRERHNTCMLLPHFEDPDLLHQDFMVVCCYNCPWSWSNFMQGSFGDIGVSYSPILWYSIICPCLSPGNFSKKRWIFNLIALNFCSYVISSTHIYW
jgi:hypothetical protein